MTHLLLTLPAFIFVLSIEAFSWAQPSPQMKSAHALVTEIKGKKFFAYLKEGYHFNDKAPNELATPNGNLKPEKLAPREIEFSLDGKNNDSGTAVLYVCDDAVTFCETHKVPIKSSVDANNLLPLKSSETASSKVITVKVTEKKDSHGFIKDNFEGALNEAKKKNQLVFIEFSAKWCPGCVRYDKEVFPTKEFQSLTKDFVKLKIDVDQFNNFDVSEKFQIKGIPTAVIVNSEGEEVDRLVDFHTMARIKTFLTAVKNDPTPLKELERKNSDSAETNLKLAQRLFATGQNSASLKYYEKLNQKPPEYLSALVAAQQDLFEKDKSKKEDLVKALRTALKEESESTRSLGWRAELLRILEPKTPEHDTVYNDGIKLSDRLLSDQKSLMKAVATDQPGEFMGYEKLLVAMYKAELLDAASQPEAEIKKAWNEAADQGAKYRIDPKKSGPSLRYMIILSAAERWDEALKQANLILKHDPKNTDVSRRKLKVLMALNRSAEAAQLGEKIISSTEGRNQFWVAETLAKAYIAEKKNQSAKKLLTAYLARPEIQTDKMKSSKKTMEELLKTVQ